MGLEQFDADNPRDQDAIPGTIVIDLSNILFRSIFVDVKASDAREISPELIRHMTINQILKYRRKFDRNRYPRLVLAFDGKKPRWRNELFPDYKWRRDNAVDEDATPKEIALKQSIFESFGIVRDEMRAHMPYPCVRVDGCEADDVMATIAMRNTEAAAETIIVSGDKDMRQLQMFRGVRVFSPGYKPENGGAFIDEPDPVGYLFRLVAKGDGGDDVPSVLSPDDFFRVKYQTGSKARQKSLYEKDLDIWLRVHNGDPKNWCQTAEELRRWERNRTLIDLRRVPLDKQEAIMADHEQEVEFVPARKSVFYKYLMEKGLQRHLENIQTF